MTDPTDGSVNFFPFGSEVFLSTAPMTDDEFAKYIVVENDEIPIEQVDFSSASPAFSV
jgi:hypothetical protein